MNSNIWNLLVPALITIIVGGISVTIAFYIKEILNKYSQYKNMKKYLEETAGKNAEIVYCGEIYKIKDINRNGLIIENKLQKIFIPIEEAINTSFILPCENYHSVKMEEQVQFTKEYMKSLMPDLINQMIDNMVPRMKEVMHEEFINDKGDFSAVLAVKFQKFFKEEVSEKDMLKLAQIKKSEGNVNSESSYIFSRKKYCYFIATHSTVV